MSSQTIQTVVVAGTFRQFEDWCREQGINPKRPLAAGVLYASGYEALRGLPDGSVTVVHTGTPPSRAVLTFEFLTRLDLIRRKDADGA